MMNRYGRFDGAWPPIAPEDPAVVRGPARSTLIKEGYLPPVRALSSP